MDVGSELRRAREKRGVSLNDLSDRTKIRTSILAAIEQNAVERLPGGIFTRSFVKAYAREVGLNPADVSERYVAQFAPPPEADQDEGESAPARRGGWDEENDGSTQPQSTSTALLTVVVIVAAGIYAFVPRQRADAPDSVQQSAVLAMPRPADEKGAVGTAGAVDPAAAAQTAGIVRLELQPTAPCWVAATADGTRVVYRVMQPGERQTVEARREIALRVGDPAALNLSINGKPARAPGRPGEPVTVTITPETVRALFGR